jgi:hypothetical protein
VCLAGFFAWHYWLFKRGVWVSEEVTQAMWLIPRDDTCGRFSGAIQLDFWIIAGISTAAAMFFSFAGYREFPGDAHTYTQYAVSMAHAHFTPSLAFRTPGYPAILDLTGFAITRSLRAILVLQALAGAAIPVVAFMVLRPINRWLARLTALAMIVSLTPYLFINRIYPDQFYIFMLVVLAAVAARLAISDRPLWLYLATASCLLLGWLRPVGFVLILVCIGMVALRRRNLGHAVLCAALFVLAMFGLPKLERGKADKTFIGRQAFFNAYMWSDGVPNAFSSGTAALEMRADLKQFFSTDPSVGRIRQLGTPPSDAAFQQLFGRFAGHPDDQVAAMFQRPHVQYYWIISTLSTLGPPQLLPNEKEWMNGDRMLLQATLHYYWNHPWQVVRSTLLTYRGLTLGPAWRFMATGYGFDGIAREQIRFDPAQPGLGVVPTPQHDYVDSGRLFSDEAAAPAVRMRWIQRAFAAIYTFLVPASYLWMMFGIVGFIGVPGPARAVSLTAFGVHSINALALSLLVDPQFRYQAESVPLAIMGAGIGLYRLATLSTALMFGKYGKQFHKITT